MQRIVFGGPELERFPENSASGYLKLGFARRVRPRGVRSSVRFLLKDKERVFRSYTVRRFDSLKQELEMDFVLHAHGGIASTWARDARPGDELVANGPGPCKLLKQEADWFLICGDLSALPAIHVNIEQLRPASRGYAFIEIADDADKQPLDPPQGLQVRWIVNPDPARSASVMLDAVRAVEWLPGQAEAWVAGELAMTRAVRAYLRDERGIGRELMYASSYWQLGRTDEQHRKEKSRDR